MSTFDWIGQVERLSPAALTVRAQALPVNDQGQLLWDAFMPRENVPSIDLSDVMTTDYRPTADRREWNAPGRYIPPVIPTTRRIEMVPIEAYDKIEERELQKLAEGTFGNTETVIREMGNRIPDRTDRLALADYRRLEVDTWAALALGTFTQRNAQNGATYALSYGFSSSRYTTAGTAWNDAGVNAYDLFLAYLQSAQDMVGAVEGAMMRQATANAILADAPTIGAGSVKMTFRQLNIDIEDRLGTAFNIVINERSVDVFDDGGTAYTRTKVFPAQRVLAIPAGGRLGRTAFAPVRRAMELAAQVPGAGIDVRGATVYHYAGNGGKELNLEATLNAFSLPDESLLYVQNVGV